MRKEERRGLRSTAVAMLKKGLDKQIVAEVTSLQLVEIEKLAEP